ncbi:TetR/AcrR family transcriptional regulator [Roseomonas alkaliterrae]|uniref:TetR/AcrR family transcriptional repressor of nem operon n=1 Tax=Neoroseomonas alkaliterrae TaxID=1452450 RepID=A0A840Y3I8_9PROT|nr:TetR/AcrR family transcriptional regulator [Neoroseomonas alkaliterrae]MBB5688763.1 TetR/AcrR family transcriptional repressor of nem operon [Neoroseomonas alkaliterrae]MBR0675115.1 TetR/AcrR family transcriptional regulator [Neoroseomonas alkaliterrae]
MSRGEARQRLLDAAIGQIRARGYAATSVDELCTAAGVTKGAFFHHFRTKEDLGIAAAARFIEWLDGIFARSGWRDHADPLDRVLAYIDVRIRLLRGDVPHFTCLIGTMVQEVHATHPALRTACEAGIRDHLAPLQEEIAAAMAARGVTGFTPGSLAQHVMAVIQGAFVLAKAEGGPEAAAESLRHLRRYVAMLFREHDA